MTIGREVLLTEQGWRALREELDGLLRIQGQTLEENPDLIRMAGPGQLAAEYEQSDMAPIDRRIAELEEVLSRAIPIGIEDRESGVVGVGSRLTTCWDEEDEEESYTLVGPPEVHPDSGRISYESPLGRALLGRRSGDWVGVATPEGTRRMRILAVS